ncbi:MAG: VWA domain-containing protein [Gammaproteobacteria bacterium]|nr:VWA domain-containing protein [Gammaproteobacteria bacterium]
MEDKVGEIWDRLITTVADTGYPDAVVHLDQVRLGVGVMFRALGGDGGLQVDGATATQHGARRSLLQRIAGSNQRVELAWRDEHSLRLPVSIDTLPTPELNRDLYLWLAALAVAEKGEDEPWFTKNQRLTLLTLDSYPGIHSRYQRLLAAHLALRPDPARLNRQEAAQERRIRQALLEPGSQNQLPTAKRPPHPVPLWLHPAPPVSDGQSDTAPDVDADRQPNGDKTTHEDERRRKAERTDAPQEDRGLVTIRMENIFTWGEYTKVDRGTEENDDLEQAQDVADDMEVMSISRDDKSTAGRLRFDLDLPSEEHDDLVLNSGILLPEWDFKRQQLQADHCRIVPMLSADAEPCELPDNLRCTARRLRAQFQHIAPARVWHPAQQEGSEIDLEAYLRFVSDRRSGHVAAADGLYRDLRIGARDLASLLLADLSLSTDSWINDRDRIIDVIRDSLFLFAESLAATRDRFAIHGFSSRRRDPVRFHQLKTFDETYTASIRGRINAIKPGYYTRMGAAIRYGSKLLKDEPAGRRLLLLLTDGKPNDLDKYEGRYGIEDTRHAIHEARQLGLQPFCVTIDNRANDYLPYLFGSGGFVVIHKPSQLPNELPQLYARLTT